METNRALPGQVSRIVVGIDGSANSLAALDYSIRLGRALGADIVAVLALPSIVYGRAYGRRILLNSGDERRQLRRMFREEWCRPLIDSGLKYKAVVETGEPAAAITAVAERERVDLIVVGRRGQGAIAEFLLGSVSRELSLRCRLPLLLVSPATAATMPAEGPTSQATVGR